MAGPEVFLPFSSHSGNFLKAQILLFNQYHLKHSDYNLEGLFPFDGYFKPKKYNFSDGVEVYNSDVDIMNRSSAIMANMVKMRGPGMDGGTAFEIGYMSAQKKLVVGYYDENPYYEKPKANRLYLTKVEEEMGVVLKEKKSLGKDKNGHFADFYEMPENPMMLVPTLTPDGKLNIPDSSWGALFVLKEKFDFIRNKK